VHDPSAAHARAGAQFACRSGPRVRCRWPDPAKSTWASEVTERARRRGCRTAASASERLSPCSPDVPPPRTQAVTTSWPVDARLRTKAGLNPPVAAHLVFARGAPLHALDGPALRSATAAALLCRDCRSHPSASCRPDPRQPASAPGSRSRGRAATLVNPHLAPGPDESRKR